MNWPQLTYQYAFGGAFFFISLYLCFKLGAASRKISSDRKALYYLLAGFAGYLVMHTLWIILAS